MWKFKIYDETQRRDTHGERRRFETEIVEIWEILSVALLGSPAQRRSRGRGTAEPRWKDFSLSVREGGTPRGSEGGKSQKTS